MSAKDQKRKIEDTSRKMETGSRRALLPLIGRQLLFAFLSHRHHARCCKNYLGRYDRRSCTGVGAVGG